uniref:Uncharacterized protein n=1 Tax=Anguilla anguilla TaxID=7936 RepID=A0A0E9RUR3_ANGAN
MKQPENARLMKRDGVASLLTIPSALHGFRARLMVINHISISSTALRMFLVTPISYPWS